MASERTVERIASWIHRKVATMLLRDLQDPRAAFITVTRVKVSRDLETAIVFYSVLGGDADKSKAAHLLERARPFLRREVAKGLHTRTAPDLKVEYDESIAGTAHMAELLDRLARERESREAGARAGDAPSAAESAAEASPDDRPAGDFSAPSKAPSRPSEGAPPLSREGPAPPSSP